MKKRTRNQTVYIIGSVAFVKHPHAPVIWLKSHPCVAFVACPYSTCKAKPGEPCNSYHGGPGQSTHVGRRTAYKEYRRQNHSPASVVVQVTT